jgi:hypothetical protein
MYEINDSNEYLINTPVRNNYLYNFLPYNIYYPKDYNKDKNLRDEVMNDTDYIAASCLGARVIQVKGTDHDNNDDNDNDNDHDRYLFIQPVL